MNGVPNIGQLPLPLILDEFSYEYRLGKSQFFSNTSTFISILSKKTVLKPKIQEDTYKKTKTHIKEKSVIWGSGI